MLAFQFRVTECDVPVTPVPERDTTIVLEEAELVIVTLPVTAPALDGANVTVSVAVCPGDSVKPEGNPFTVNPAPEMLTFEIESDEVPVFVTVAVRALLLPIFTLPKLKVAGERLRPGIVLLFAAPLEPTAPTHPTNSAPRTMARMKRAPPQQARTN